MGGGMKWTKSALKKLLCAPLLPMFQVENWYIFGFVAFSNVCPVRSEKDFISSQQNRIPGMLYACIPGCLAVAALSSLSGERLSQAISSCALKGAYTPASLGSLFRAFFRCEKFVYLRIAVQDKCHLEGKIRCKNESSISCKGLDDLHPLHLQLNKCTCAVCSEFLLKKSCPGLASLD